MVRYMPQFKRLNGKWQDALGGFGVASEDEAVRYVDATSYRGSMGQRVVKRTITEQVVYVKGQDRK